jgi:hypothetical protein
MAFHAFSSEKPGSQGPGALLPTAQMYYGIDLHARKMWVCIPDFTIILDKPLYGSYFFHFQNKPTRTLKTFQTFVFRNREKETP